jgi:hypothetical protein
VTPVDEKTMSKIRKIQVLADHAGTEGEAQAAMNALQNLLKKHGMKSSEITAESEVEEDVNQLVVDETGVKQHWKGWLGKVVASNFRCTVYWTYGQHKSGKWGSKLVFLGLETEVLLAQTCYQSAVLTMGRLRDQHLYARQAEAKQGGSRWDQQDGKAASKAYLAGFIRGLEESFDENVRKGAIVLYKSPKVEQATLDLKLTSGLGSNANYWGDGKAREAGTKDGLSHGRTSGSTKLNGGGQKELNA